MENTGINITLRKDGRYVGKFITDYDCNGKAHYQYVYGKTYDEAEHKVMIGREVATRFFSGKYITVRKIYTEWMNAVANRVKESTLANYQNKFEKHILPEFGYSVCRSDRRQDKCLYKSKALRGLICELCAGYFYCF